MPAIPSPPLRLRPDARGYVLGDVSHDGFSDREELPLDERARLARWAKRYTPTEISETQRSLLTIAPGALSAGATAVLEAALADAEEDNPRAVDLGFHDLLDDDELEQIRTARYPLGVDALAELTGTSAKQIRGWSNSGLLPHHRIGSRRQFFSAAAIHAAALSRLDPYQVAVLGLILRGGDSLDAFLPLLAGTLESIAPRLDGDASRQLSEAGRVIARLSHEIATIDRSAA